MGLKLEVSGISKSYNGNCVLNECSFSFDSGGIYVLMGQNGSGKSTFLRICALLENPDKGEVNYFSGDIAYEEPCDLPQGIKYQKLPSFPDLIGESRRRPRESGELFKELDSLVKPENDTKKPCSKTTGNYQVKKDIELKRRITLVLPKIGVFNASVFKNVAYGLKIRGLKKKEVEDRANTVLEFVGLMHKKNDNALTLSSGEAQRLGIARAMVIEPEALFLDEPTASVDQENTEIIERIILDMKKDDRSTIIITTHDTAQAERLAGRMLIIQDGKIIEKTF